MQGGSRQQGATTTEPTRTNTDTTSGTEDADTPEAERRRRSQLEDVGINEIARVNQQWGLDIANQDAGDRFNEQTGQGDGVEALQDKLMAAGFDLPNYGSDGILGPETNTALEAYIRQHGNEFDPPLSLENRDAAMNQLLAHQGPLPGTPAQEAERSATAEQPAPGTVVGASAGSMGADRDIATHPDQRDQSIAAGVDPRLRAELDAAPNVEAQTAPTVSNALDTDRSGGVSAAEFRIAMQNPQLRRQINDTVERLGGSTRSGIEALMQRHGLDVGDVTIDPPTNNILDVSPEAAAAIFNTPEGREELRTQGLLRDERARGTLSRTHSAVAEGGPGTEAHVATAAAGPEARAQIQQRGWVHSGLGTDLGLLGTDHDRNNSTFRTVISEAGGEYVPGGGGTIRARDGQTLTSQELGAAFNTLVQDMRAIGINIDTSAARDGVTLGELNAAIVSAVQQNNEATRGR